MATGLPPPAPSDSQSVAHRARGGDSSAARIGSANVWARRNSVLAGSACERTSVSSSQNSINSGVSSSSSVASNSRVSSDRTRTPLHAADGGKLGGCGLGVCGGGLADGGEEKARVGRGGFAGVSRTCSHLRCRLADSSIKCSTSVCSAADFALSSCASFSAISARARSSFSVLDGGIVDGRVAGARGRARPCCQVTGEICCFSTRADSHSSSAAAADSH